MVIQNYSSGYKYAFSSFFLMAQHSSTYSMVGLITCNFLSQMTLVVSFHLFNGIRTEQSSCNLPVPFFNRFTSGIITNTNPQVLLNEISVVQEFCYVSAVYNLPFKLSIILLRGGAGRKTVLLILQHTNFIVHLL